MSAAEQIEHLCEVMHDAYEAAAARNGWATQAASRKPWAEVPETNKATMRAAVVAVLAEYERSRLIDGPLKGRDPERYEVEVVDLVASLRASVEAAKNRPAEAERARLQGGDS